MIARRGHKVWTRRPTIDRLTKLEHAAEIYRDQPWGVIDNELAARGLCRRLRLALPHCLSVLHAVASSDWWNAFRNPSWAPLVSLGLSSCAEPLGLPPFALRMVWHRQRNDDPAQAWLRKLIQKETAARREPRCGNSSEDKPACF